MFRINRSFRPLAKRVAGFGALLLTVLALGVSVPAATGWAQPKPLDAPRIAGTVGEQYTGFAVVRDSGAPAQIKSMVDEINAQRRAHYQGVAAKENAPVEAIGKIYAKEIFKNAPKGTWFLQENGSWIQK